jgi:large subunit ribosomal protein L28
MSEPAQLLAQDHPGVSPGAQKSRPGHEPRQDPQTRVLGGAGNCLSGGLKGQEDVGAGVSVWNGEDIERINLRPGFTQSHQGPAHPQAQGIGREMHLIEPVHPLTVLRWATRAGAASQRAEPAGLVHRGGARYPVRSCHIRGALPRAAHVLTLTGEVIHCSSSDPRRATVAANCDVCGKGPGFGHSISHSHIRTKRRWNPNIQRVRAVIGSTPKRVNVCTSCLKAGKITRA